MVWEILQLFYDFAASHKPESCLKKQKTVSVSKNEEKFGLGMIHLNQLVQGCPTTFRFFCSIAQARILLKKQNTVSVSKNGENFGPGMIAAGICAQEGHVENKHVFSMFLATFGWKIKPPKPTKWSEIQ